MTASPDSPKARPGRPSPFRTSGPLRRAGLAFAAAVLLLAGTWLYFKLLGHPAGEPAPVPASAPVAAATPPQSAQIPTGLSPAARVRAPGANDFQILSAPTMPAAPVSSVQAAPLPPPGYAPATAEAAPRPQKSLYEKLRGHSLGPIAGLIVLGLGFALYRNRRRQQINS